MQEVSYAPNVVCYEKRFCVIPPQSKQREIYTKHGSVIDGYDSLNPEPIGQDKALAWSAEENASILQWSARCPALVGQPSRIKHRTFTDVRKENAILFSVRIIILTTILLAAFLFSLIALTKHKSGETLTALYFYAAGIATILIFMWFANAYIV